MAKTLTIVRHAKSSWKDEGLADRDRPLNRRGERDAPRMGHRIQDAAIRPSLIVSSPAKRAWTTAKLIAAEIGYPREFLQREPHLYLASVDTILDVLVAQDAGFSSIMLVGHNPGLTSFANYLVPGLTDNLPTCGVVSVEFEHPDWSLYSLPELRLTLHDYPKKEVDDERL